MSYSDSFPAQRPSFIFDAANSGRIPPNMTYTRASTANVFDGSKHESSQNLVLQSQNFGTTWANSPTVGSGAASSGTGPDGSDSWLMTAATSGSATPSFNQSFSFKASTQYTYSVYVKAGTATHAWLAARGDTANSVTGTLNFSSPGSLATTAQGWTLNSSSVTAHGSWYRIVLTFTTNSTVSSPFVYVGLSDGAVPSTYYPAMTPNGETIYVWGAQIEERGSATAYNATTTQIHREYASSLVSKANNIGRFEVGTDGQSAGILIESSSTSLVSYSESFSNQTVNSCTLTEGAAVGPSGTLNANLLVPTSSGTVVRNVSLDDGNPISHTSGNNYAFSIYAKAAGYNYLQWVGGAYFGYTYCNFDLSNGTVGGKSGTVTGSVESVGNGFYRLTVIAPATATNNTNTKGIWAVVTSSTAARNEQFTGDAYSGVLLTMAQCELGSHSSSYIASDSGAAAGTTRAADSLSVATADIGYTGGPVTLTADYDMVDPTANVAAQNILLLSDGSSSNRVLLYNRSGKSGGYVASADGSTTASGNPSSTAAGAHKLCVVADTNNYIMSFDGTSSTDTAAVLPSGLNQIDIGSGSFSGHVSRVSLFGTAISETAANALTS